MRNLINLLLDSFDLLFDFLACLAFTYLTFYSLYVILGGVK